MDSDSVRVALIADSKSTRYYYLEALDYYDVEIIEASSGYQGWKTIITQKPDIIMLDMKLPDISGICLLKKIRSVEETRDIPVIVITETEHENESMTAMDADSTYYCTRGEASIEKLSRLIHESYKKTELEPA